MMGVWEKDGSHITITAVIKDEQGRAYLREGWGPWMPMLHGAISKHASRWEVEYVADAKTKDGKACPTMLLSHDYPLEAEAMGRVAMGVSVSPDESLDACRLRAIELLEHAGLALASIDKAPETGKKDE